MEEAAQNTNSANTGYGKRPFWQWLVIYFVFGVIIYGAIYYFFINKKGGYNYNQSSQTNQQYASPSPQAMTSNNATFVLKPVNGSTEGGIVSFKEDKGQTTVTISLIGYAKNVEQPAHIHMGECPGVGSVKYPLNPVINGASVSVIPVVMSQFKKEMPLAINVHKSKTEISSYTACGLLSFK